MQPLIPISSDFNVQMRFLSKLASYLGGDPPLNHENSTSGVHVQNLNGPAASVTVGVIVIGPSIQTATSLLPTAVAINGQLCSLTT